MARSRYSGWSWAVMATMGTGRAWVMAQAASRPSRPGMTTSMTTASGRVRAASSTARRPSATLATTWWPRAASLASSPRAMTGSSSAMSTRTGFLLHDGEPDLYPVASPVHPAGHHAREPFFDEPPDEREAETGTGAGRTRPPVLDGEFGVVAVQCQGEADGD